MKSRKRLAYGVFDHLPPILAFFVTSPTYRLLCSKWQHLWSGFATFKCQSLANRMENLVENCCVSVLYSIPVGMACEACSVWFPFKGTQYGIPKCSVMKQHLCMTDSWIFSSISITNLSENCCVSVLYSIPVGMACDACSVWFPFKGTQSGIPFMIPMTECSVMEHNLCCLRSKPSFVLLFFLLDFLLCCFECPFPSPVWTVLSPFPSPPVLSLTI